MAEKNSLTVLGVSNHSDTERQPDDYYATDPKALEMLMEHITFSHDVWEPCCGSGWLSKVLADSGRDVKNSDIVNRANLSNFEIQDFLAIPEDYKNTRDIITNPPYKLSTQIVRKALDISENGVKIAMFLRLTFLEGQERRKLIFDSDPPRYVFPFSKRIFVAKDGIFPKGSAVAYCWIVWEKGYTGKPELIWLN